jgi:hypothetical protein
MAEVTRLTPEEHEHVTNLIKSYGWRILVEKLIIPELTQVSRHVDNVASVENETQFYRGAKLTLTRLLQTVYRWGRLPNPLEEHYQALLTAVRVYTEETLTPEPMPEEKPVIPYPKRVAKPVL